MKVSIYSALLAICVFLSGCAVQEGSTTFLSGRRALIVGNNESALSSFQNVAERNPDFTFTNGGSPRQSIWSYVGRAEYRTGRFPEARQSLERALSGDREESIARLYLGLTLARDGDRERGLKEISRGMREIHNFLDHINKTDRTGIGQFWDPNRDIRRAITSNLEMISGKDINWPRLITEAERIAFLMERESDLARRQDTKQRSGDRRP